MQGTHTNHSGNVGAFFSGMLVLALLAGAGFLVLAKHGATGITTRALPTAIINIQPSGNDTVRIIPQPAINVQAPVVAPAAPQAPVDVQPDIQPVAPQPAPQAAPVAPQPHPANAAPVVQQPEAPAVPVWGEGSTSGGTWGEENTDNSWKNDPNVGPGGSSGGSTW